MAAKHNFNTGPISKYNAQGEVKWASSENELAQIKQEGFTREYVKSKYPTTAFNKKTGANKPIGKIGDTDEKVAADLAKLGPDWTFDHVPEPEPAAEKKAADLGGLDVAALLQLGGQIALLTERLSTVEAALVQSEETRINMASRLGELEAMVVEDVPSMPTIEQAQAKEAKAEAPGAKTEKVPVATGKK